MNHKDFLTNQEHVLWMDDMKQCILKTLNDTLEVRDTMVDIRKRENARMFGKRVTDKKYEEKLNADRIKCDTIHNMCMQDTEIIELMNKLERAHEDSILELVMFILNSNRVLEKKWNELGVDERDAVKKIFNVTYSTDSVRTYVDIKKSDEIIEELYMKVSAIINGDKTCLDIEDILWARSRNEVLLEKAKKECGKDV